MRLNEEYSDIMVSFTAWYSRCDRLLLLDPSAATVAAADVAKAVELVAAQQAEGKAHTTRADAIAREIQTLGGELKPREGKVRATDSPLHAIP